MSENGAARLGVAEYADLVGRVRETVVASVPPSSSLLVVSKGDASLLEIPGAKAMHFPQDGAGAYAGHHPLDSATAIEELERMRRAGAEYIVLPATARWWLDFYEDFARHLAHHCELVVDAPGACLVYGLGQRRANGAGAASLARPQASLAQLREYLQSLLTTDKRLVVLEAVDGVAVALGPFKVDRLRARGEPEEAVSPVLAELRLLAAAGADYLVVPRSSDEWLDADPELVTAVESSCRRIAEQRHLCRVFDLEGLKEIA